MEGNKMKWLKQRLGGMLFCVIEAIIGILLLINPMGFTSGIVKAIGIVVAVFGAVLAVKYFRVDADTASKEQLLTKGLLMVLLGLFCFFGTAWIIGVFPIITLLYGIIILVTAVMKLQASLDSLRRGEKNWFLGLAGAALSLACSAVIILNPFASAAALWMFIGIMMIAYAVFDFVAVVLRGAGNRDVSVNDASESEDDTEK